MEIELSDRLRLFFILSRLGQISTYDFYILQNFPFLARSSFLRTEIAYCLRESISIMKKYVVIEEEECYNNVSEI